MEDFIKDFTKDFAAKPPAERSEATKVSIYLYMFSAEGEQLVFTYVLIG